MLHNGTDLGLIDPRALNAHGGGGAGPQIEGIALTGEGLGPVLVEDDARVQLGGGGEGQARGHIGLDQAGDHGGDRALRGQHQMNTGGTGQLGDALDGGLDVLGRGHHEVGELIDDHQEIGIGRDDALRTGQGLDLPRAHRPVEVVDVLVAEGGEIVVAGVHLAHDPLQRLSRLLGAGDDGGDQVRNALVDRQLDALGVDQHHADLFRGGPHHDRGDHGVHERGLARAGLTGHEHVGRLGEIGDHIVALDVLAQPHDQGVRLLLGGARAQDVAELDHLTVGVGDLHADGALAGDRGQQADLVRAHRVGDVLLLTGHPGDIDAAPQVDLVASDLRAAGVAGDRGVDLEFGENTLKLLDNRVVGLGARGVARSGLQKALTGQGVGRAVGQRH